MYTLLGAFASVLLVVALASAADDKPTHASPAHRTAECAAKASDRHLTGDVRGQFISECLAVRTTMREATSASEKESHSGTPTGGQRQNTQGEKMKTCNHEASAKNLHGDERKAFMSQCLKADKKS